VLKKDKDSQLEETSNGWCLEIQILMNPGRSENGDIRDFWISLGAAEPMLFPHVMIQY
jgi:hypothetical protein